MQILGRGSLSCIALFTSCGQTANYAGYRGRMARRCTMKTPGWGTLIIATPFNISRRKRSVTIMLRRVATPIA
jgi:hypothetical protein